MILVATSTARHANGDECDITTQAAARRRRTRRPQPAHPLPAPRQARRDDRALRSARRLDGRSALRSRRGNPPPPAPKPERSAREHAGTARGGTASRPPRLGDRRDSLGSLPEDPGEAATPLLAPQRFRALEIRSLLGWSRRPHADASTRGPGTRLSLSTISTHIAGASPSSRRPSRWPQEGCAQRMRCTAVHFAGP